MMVRVEYCSNNSGGMWWLDDQDWRNLEAAGWIVAWKKDSTEPFTKAMVGADGRWLGALATNATREGLSLPEAIAEWERITSQSAEAAGCSCCGQPHDFYEREAPDAAA